MMNKLTMPACSSCLPSVSVSIRRARMERVSVFLAASRMMLDVVWAASTKFSVPMRMSVGMMRGIQMRK